MNYWDNLTNYIYAFTHHKVKPIKIYVEGQWAMIPPLGGGFKYFLFSPPSWGDDPIWRIFFNWVGPPFSFQLNKIRSRCACFDCTSEASILDAYVREVGLGHFKDPMDIIKDNTGPACWRYVFFQEAAHLNLRDVYLWKPFEKYLWTPYK